ncbi:FadR/GntR family transcriptional regulator [Streptomyces sp. NPDC057137]|uniref:FadR/GntR family transcriptional regulator n=1 Tax=Streptomyces sp. NPDC057137 TaxID=3346030 RepID=UPI00362EC727
MNAAQDTTARRSSPRAAKQSEVVARELLHRIVAEKLPEGTRLPTEKVMAEELAIGRSTLREALRILESHGVLTIRAGRAGGPIVRHPRPSDLGQALTMLLQFEGASFSDVFEARHALEPRLAAMAATRIRAPALARLQQTILRMEEYLDESVVFQRENLVFHEVIAEASGSNVLRLLMLAVESVAGGTAFGPSGTESYSRAQRAAVLAAHKRIYEALAAGDEAASEAAMADHSKEAGGFWKAANRDLSKHHVQWGR